MLPENKTCLLLSPYPYTGEGAIHSILETLEWRGLQVTTVGGPVDYDAVAEHNPLLILSYGYRHHIPRDVWGSFSTLNLHISALPWNRGADPNLWSWVENTPKGVSLHWVDDGWDTGPIVQSWDVPMNVDTDTLETSYNRLHEWAGTLLRSCLGQILKEWPRGTPQVPGTGSFHRARDRSKVEHLLVHGWQTPVRSLVGKVPHVR